MSTLRAIGTIGNLVLSLIVVIAGVLALTTLFPEYRYKSVATYTLVMAWACLWSAYIGSKLASARAHQALALIETYGEAFTEALGHVRDAMQRQVEFDSKRWADAGACAQQALGSARTVRDLIEKGGNARHLSLMVADNAVDSCEELLHVLTGQDWSSVDTDPKPETEAPREPVDQHGCIAVAAVDETAAAVEHSTRS